jgi:hypothetical protein
MDANCIAYPIPGNFGGKKSGRKKHSFANGFFFFARLALWAAFFPCLGP